jgi:hypothetical protein
LTTGAKAGIGVGVALGGLGFILGALALFLMLRRGRKQKENQDPQGQSHNEQDIAEKAAPHTPEPVPPQELSTHVYTPELPGSYGGHEVDGTGAKGQPV